MLDALLREILCFNPYELEDSNARFEALRDIHALAVRISETGTATGDRRVTAGITVLDVPPAAQIDLTDDDDYGEPNVRLPKDED